MATPPPDANGRSSPIDIPGAVSYTYKPPGQRRRSDIIASYLKGPSPTVAARPLPHTPSRPSVPFDTPSVLFDHTDLPSPLHSNALPHGLSSPSRTQHSDPPACHDNDPESPTSDTSTLYRMSQMIEVLDRPSPMHIQADDARAQLENEVRTLRQTIEDSASQHREEVHALRQALEDARRQASEAHAAEEVRRLRQGFEDARAEGDKVLRLEVMALRHADAEIHSRLQGEVHCLRQALEDREQRTQAEIQSLRLAMGQRGRAELDGELGKKLVRRLKHMEGAVEWLYKDWEEFQGHALERETEVCGVQNGRIELVGHRVGLLKRRLEALEAHLQAGTVNGGPGEGEEAAGNGMMSRGDDATGGLPPSELPTAADNRETGEEDKDDDHESIAMISRANSSLSYVSICCTTSSSSPSTPPLPSIASHVELNEHGMAKWPAEWPVFWEGADPTGIGRWTTEVTVRPV